MPTDGQRDRGPDDLSLGFMRRALQLAQQGQGQVEPNPLVGCVLVRQDNIVGAAGHQRFGGPHAEALALAEAGAAAQGATAYVTLEPCCHQGKTPPCSAALIQAGVTKVVVGARDPNPLVAGQGMAELRQAGVEVIEGVLAEEATRLIAPFAKLMTQAKPWVIAKWAMTLDGKLASRTGSSQWISGPESRAVVHQLRGRVDAIVVGRGTVVADDPLLTARPAGPRQACRIVLDSQASLATDGQLFRTRDEAPLLVAVAASAPQKNRDRLARHGAEVLVLAGDDPPERVRSLLDQLGQRRLTNVLVEGGAGVLGAFFDAQHIDEVHAFIAPRLVGGRAALGAVGGQGLSEMSAALKLQHVTTASSGEDVHVHGYLV